MTDEMLLYVLTAPLVWLIACAAYFGYTVAEPTYSRFAIMLGPIIITLVALLFI